MATAAAKAEATGTPITFDFDGAAYTIPASNRWPLDAVEAFEEGRAAAAVRGLLGADQYKTFRQTATVVDDLTRMYAAIEGAAGIEGN